MPVTVNGGNLPSKKTPARTRKDDKFDPSKFEVYGRLNLTARQMAQLEYVSEQVVTAALRRPELRMAYDKGRAETTVAIRQKQISVALAGDSRLLVHAGEKFADLGEGVEQGVPEHYNPGQHSWDGKFRDRVEVLRAKFIDDDEEDEAGTG